MGTSTALLSVEAHLFHGKSVIVFTVALLAFINLGVSFLFFNDVSERSYDGHITFLLIAETDIPRR